MRNWPTSRLGLPREVLQNDLLPGCAPQHSHTHIIKVVFEISEAAWEGNGRAGVLRQSWVRLNPVPGCGCNSTAHAGTNREPDKWAWYIRARPFGVPNIHEG